MNERLYITLAYSMNVAAQAFGYVNLLPPRRGKLATALLFTGLTAIPIFAVGPLLKEHLWVWTTVIPTMFLLLMVLFRGTFARKLGFFTLMCLTELFADLMLWPLALAISGSRSFGDLQDYVFSPSSLLIRISYALILLALITVILLLLRRHKAHAVDRRQPALTLFVSIQALAQVVLMAITLVHTEAVLEKADVFTLWILNGCGLCMLAAFLAVTLREEKHAAQLDAAVVRSSMEQQYAHSHSAYLEEAQRIRTEVLAQLDSLIEGLQAGTETLSLPGSLKPQYSDSLAVNALLEHKIEQAAARNIRISCRGRLEIPALSEFAMCTVVANLLDNAVASVAEDQPWVTLDCVKRGGIWSLVCRNSMRPPDQMRRRASSRSGRHGLGLSIIRATALEAGGRMYLQSTADTFSVILSFSPDAP